MCAGRIKAGGEQPIGKKAIRSGLLNNVGAFQRDPLEDGPRPAPHIHKFSQRDVCRLSREGQIR
jgi:hypothetical protein